MKKVIRNTISLLIVIGAGWLWVRTPVQQALTTTREPSQGPPKSPALGRAEHDRIYRWVPFSNKEEVLGTRAMPEFKRFLQRLAGAGMSPLDPGLSTNIAIPAEAGSNRYALQCRFTIDGRWVAVYSEIPETDLTRRFVGIDAFEQTGPDDPYAAVSAGDTNRLAKMRSANPMERKTAAKALASALAAILSRDQGEPDALPERYYGYDLNHWYGRWWKPGKDHWNQLNLRYEVVIQPQNATQAVVVMYRDGIAGEK